MEEKLTMEEMERRLSMESRALVEVWAHAFCGESADTFIRETFEALQIFPSPQVAVLAMILQLHIAADVLGIDMVTLGQQIARGAELLKSD